MTHNAIPQYYSNINKELLDFCPSASNVIEFGCGAGRFLGAYKHTHPKAICTGFELFEEAGKAARDHCDHVIIGNAEDPSFIDHNLKESSFDLIIYGDVIEHFLNPWQTLAKHVTLLKPAGTICACIPNASNWSFIFSLLNGQFEYKDSGLFDRTHLRFFTRSSIEKMFRDLGLTTEAIKPRQFKLKNTQHGLQTLAQVLQKPVSEISPRRLEDWATFQYLVKATKPEK